MVSVITCSKNNQEYNELKDNLKQHMPIGTEFLKMRNFESMACGYNRGIERSKGNLLVFCHEDIRLFNTKGASTVVKLLRELQDDTIGFVGVAGSSEYKDLRWWENSGSVKGQVFHCNNIRTWTTYYGPNGDAMVLDGILLACNKSLFDEIGLFDESIPGFDFYDIEITLRSFSSGKRNVVHSIPIIHKSLGDGVLKDNWIKASKQVSEKYSNLISNPID